MKFIYKLMIFASSLIYTKSNLELSEYNYRQPARRFSIPSFESRSNLNGFRENRFSRNGEFSSEESFGNKFNGDFFSSKEHKFHAENHEFEPVRKIIHKHVYAYVPPPEPVEERPQRPVFVPPAEKHYKILFIKVPTPPAPTAPVIPLQQEKEEKTIVYVLVKKPEEAPEISIPTPAPTQPSKPEVYFIRYKARTEGYEDSHFSEDKGHSSHILNEGPPIDSAGDVSKSGSDRNLEKPSTPSYKYDVPK